MNANNISTRRIDHTWDLLKQREYNGISLFDLWNYCFLFENFCLVSEPKLFELSKQYSTHELFCTQVNIINDKLSEFYTKVINLNLYDFEHPKLVYNDECGYTINNVLVSEIYNLNTERDNIAHDMQELYNKSAYLNRIYRS